MSRALQYLGPMEGLWWVDAGRHNHDVVSKLPEPLDEVGKPNLHACSMNERGLCISMQVPPQQGAKDLLCAA